MAKAKTQKSEKNKGGRPPKYSTAKALIDAGKVFFDLCDKTRQLPEKAGLCLHLGISRDTYSEYRKTFPDAIKAFDLYIESCWVRRLSGQAATGAIFYLKNAFRDDYKDRHEHTGEDGGPMVVKIVNYGDHPPA